MEIKDSGTRRQFESGAVRDMAEGKGRCDLLPLHEVCQLIMKSRMHEAINCNELEKDEMRKRTIDVGNALMCIEEFQKSGDEKELVEAALIIGDEVFGDVWTTILELAIHFEQGAKKYGDRNWEKGLPVYCFVDSGIRHLMKLCRGDEDEPHDRAFVWNMLCGAWTCRNFPELNIYKKEASSGNTKQGSRLSSLPDMRSQEKSPEINSKMHRILDDLEEQDRKNKEKQGEDERAKFMKDTGYSNGELGKSIKIPDFLKLNK